MGNKNKERDEAQRQYNQQLQAANQESPYERRRREFSEGVIKFAEGGDYRDPQGPMRVFFNFSDPAERQRRSEVLSNTRGTGVSALGAGANPDLLALNKQHMDSVAERDQAENYQQTLSTVVGQAYDMQGDLQKTDQAKRLGVLGVAGQRVGQAPARRSWFDTLNAFAHGVGQGVGSIATGGA